MPDTRKVCLICEVFSNKCHGHLGLREDLRVATLVEAKRLSPKVLATIKARSEG